MAIAAHISNSTQPPIGSQWGARLALRVAGGGRGSRLTHASHEGPLYVQKPFYPEGLQWPHIYLLHPPGGIVSGDALTIDLSLEAAASLLITTPGCNRLYRARHDHPEQAPLKQRVHAVLALQKKCVLEWFPMETIVFSGASIDLKTEVQLQDDALFCGWEVVCLGLPANREQFSEGHILQSFSLYRNQVPLLVDRLNIAAGSSLLSARCGMAGQPVSGLFIVGPLPTEAFPEPGVETLMQALRDKIVQQQWHETVSVTLLNELIVIRYLGAYADQARAAFTALWQLLRPVILQREAVLPRIWAT